MEHFPSERVLATSSMSSLRALLCGLLGVITVTTVLAAQELRDTIGPLEQKANPITPENPIPRRTRSVAPSYPAQARAVAATATVVLAATIDESGCVAEIRRGREPLLTTAAVPAPTGTALKSAADAFVREAAAALRRWHLDQAALDAVRQWVYAPTCLYGAATPLIVVVPVSFELP